MKLIKPYKLASRILSAVNKQVNGVEAYEFYKRYGIPPGYLARIVKYLESKGKVTYKDYVIMKR